MSKNTGKNISKNWSDKYSQKRIEHAKQSPTDAFNTTLKRAIQKAEEGTGDMIVNKITDKIKKGSKRFENLTTEKFRSSYK